MLSKFFMKTYSVNSNARFPTSGLFPELRIGFRNPDVARQHPAVISGKPEVPTMYDGDHAKGIVTIMKVKRPCQRQGGHGD